RLSWMARARISALRPVRVCWGWAGGAERRLFSGGMAVLRNQRRVPVGTRAGPGVQGARGAFTGSSRDVHRPGATGRRAKRPEGAGTGARMILSPLAFPAYTLRIPEVRKG